MGRTAACSAALASFAADTIQKAQRPRNKRPKLRAPGGSGRCRIDRHEHSHRGGLLRSMTNRMELRWGSASTNRSIGSRRSIVNFGTESQLPCTVSSVRFARQWRKTRNRRESNTLECRFGGIPPTAMRPRVDHSLQGGQIMAISGIQAVLEMLAIVGVRYIFGNPGTTELPLNVCARGRRPLPIHPGAPGSGGDGDGRRFCHGLVCARLRQIIAYQLRPGSDCAGDTLQLRYR